MGYSFQLEARDLLYAPSHRQNSRYHSFWYTSCGEIAKCVYHEGSIRWPITPWDNALPFEGYRSSCPSSWSSYLMAKLTGLSSQLHRFTLEGKVLVGQVQMSDIWMTQQSPFMTGWLLGLHSKHVGLIVVLDMGFSVGVSVQTDWNLKLVPAHNFTCLRVVLFLVETSMWPMNAQTK